VERPESEKDNAVPGTHRSNSAGLRLQMPVFAQSIPPWAPERPNGRAGGPLCAFRGTGGPRMDPESIAMEANGRAYGSKRLVRSRAAARAASRSKGAPRARRAWAAAKSTVF